MDEHYAALKGRDCLTITITPTSKNREYTEIDTQKPGPDNKGMRGTKAVYK
ncbi:MAG: hypothetical protein WBV70_07845 [Candidatus Bathyarchaeia archaeon]